MHSGEKDTLSLSTIYALYPTREAGHRLQSMIKVEVGKFTLSVASGKLTTWAKRLW